MRPEPDQHLIGKTARMVDRRLALLDDRPDAAPQVKHLFEQDRIANEMAQCISIHLLSDHEGKPAPPLFIALHGRHGQGKSRVVQKIRAALGNPSCYRRKVWTHHQRPFDCADYSADELLQKFDHFMHQGRMLRSILLSVTLVALAGLLLWGLLPEDQLFDRWWAAATALLIAVLAPMMPVLRDALRGFRLGEPILRIVGDVFDRSFLTAELLVVDDLDRASPEQQSALLHSLNRFRRSFRGVVLFAFDDAPLIKSSLPRRESSELMTKIFDVSYRLSPMSADDAGRLAAELGLEICKRNTDCVVAKRFKEPSVCGGLARVFLINGNASARYARKMINAVYAEAALARLEHPADLLAKIRLAAIAQYLPAIETDLDFLADSLLNASHEVIFEQIAARYGETLDHSSRHRLGRLLDATRHMQPARLQWMLLLRIWRDTSAPEGAGLAPEGWTPHYTRLWASNEALIARLTDPAARLAHWRDLANRPFAVLVDPELGNALNQQKVTSPKKDNAPKESAPADAKNPDCASDHPAPQPDDRESRAYWRALALTLLIQDHAAFALLPEDEYKSLLSEHRKQPAPALAVSSPSLRLTKSPLDGLAHAIREPGKHRSGIGFAKLQHEWRMWALSGCKDAAPSHAEWPEFDGVSVHRAIAQHWPDFSATAREWLAQRHFREFGAVLGCVPKYDTICPPSHGRWLLAQAKAERYGMIDDVLALAHGDPPLWHPGFQKGVWRALGADWRGYATHMQTRLNESGADLYPLWSLAALKPGGDAGADNSFSDDIDAFLKDMPVPCGLKQALAQPDTDPSVAALIFEMQELWKLPQRVWG